MIQVYKFKDLGFLISVLTIAMSTDVVAEIGSGQQFLPVITGPLEEEKCQPKNEGSSVLCHHASIVRIPRCTVSQLMHLFWSFTSIKCEIKQNKINLK